jgi:phenylalanyl-tRNA synthetase alpha subunit
MSSWSDLIKKNNQVSRKSLKSNIKDNKKEVQKEEDNELILYKTYGLKNEEEEFDYKYNDNLTNIIVEFKDLLNSSGVNVMNNRISSDLYDFIKYNSQNYNDIMDEVDKYNDILEKEYEDEIEEEEEKYYYYR